MHTQPHDWITERGRPFTGLEYLASLSDGREVYLNGQRVADVASHPGFRNAARSIARLYDDLHDPARHGTLTCPLDPAVAAAGGDDDAPDRAAPTAAAAPVGYTHRAFRVARTSADLVAQRDAIAEWSRRSFGWMGRTPDYKASLTNTLGAVPEWYGPFEPQARRWHALAQRHVPFLSHSVVNPPIDRHKPPHEIKDVCVHVRRETDAGLIVSGAKVVATSAALCHYNFVGQTPATASDDPSLAVSFILPINAAGVKIIARRSYELAADAHGSPFDSPLSARFDENDAILVMDDVLVPWDNVLIHRDPTRTRAFFLDTGFLNGFLFHGCTRLAVKLDFLAGLLAKALRLTGGDEHRGSRALLGEVLAARHAVWAFSDAMCFSPDPWPGSRDGALIAQRQAALAYSVLSPSLYTRVREAIQHALASALIYLPGSAADLDHPDLAPVLARYVRGSRDAGHRERIKVMKLMWDAIGSEFAARHELYERHYAGGPDAVRLQTLVEAERTGRLADIESLADECLAQYDTEGWTDATWLNPPHLPRPRSCVPLVPELKPFREAA